MIQIPCHCGNIIETDIEKEIDLSLKKELYRDIIEGDFMTFHCPKCGNDIKAETELLLKDPENGIDIHFIPDIDRTNFLSGKITSSSKRVAIGYRELVEKIIILGAKLDDRIIEIIKFRLLEKAESASAEIFFHGIENEKLIFYIHGLKADQVGISNIPVKIYNSMESQLTELLDDEDIKLFTDGAYVSVNRIYLED